jgi:hypothetical protein
MNNIKYLAGTVFAAAGCFAVAVLAKVESNSMTIVAAGIASAVLAEIESDRMPKSTWRVQGELWERDVFK